MDEPVPFIPGGREIDTGYFPNANANDEELKQIESDKKHQVTTHKDFNNFDGVCYGTLQSINAKEAKKAMVRAQKQRIGSPHDITANRFISDSILNDFKNAKVIGFEEEAAAANVTTEGF